MRSRAIYYWKPGNLQRMWTFYKPFIQPGDLCFDLGAHIGNRTAVWRKLGARVIAVEPQPRCIRELKSRFGKDSSVTILPIGMSRESGEAILHINSGSPTISTLREPAWQTHMANYSSKTETWDEEVSIQTKTLDDLIAEYGTPAFCKIDVEGFELEVLQGLHQPLPHLSVEFFSQDLKAAWMVLDRLEHLGSYRYNYSLREQHDMRFKRYQPRNELVEALSGLSDEVISGDIYAKWQST